MHANLKSAEWHVIVAKCGMDAWDGFIIAMPFPILPFALA